MLVGVDVRNEGRRTFQMHNHSTITSTRLREANDTDSCATTAIQQLHSMENAPIKPDNVSIRQFETGATRDTDVGKHDYEGFLSPLVIERFGEYMTKHRHQSDGKLRDSDNWQRGIPLAQYIKSGWRHFFDWWKAHRGYTSREGLEDALCGLLFNAMGYLHEHLKARGYGQNSD